VLRARGLGDLVFSMPALEALQGAHPEAEIVLLGEEWHREFFQRRPGPVHRVETLPGGARCVQEPDEGQALTGFLQRMQGERFDLAVQLFGGGRQSNPFLLRLGARFTVGCRTQDAPALDAWVPYVYYQSEQARCLEVVALAGVRPRTWEPTIAVTAGDLVQASAWTERRPGSGGDQPVAAVHPGCGARRRRWPAEKFALVADDLAQAGARVLVTGSRGEAALVQDVLGAMHRPAEDLSGAMDLGGLAGLFSRCAVVVSNDTGPLHLARAVGAATVGVFWCGNLINAGPLTRSRHRPVLSWRLHCPACGLDCTQGDCDHDASFVEDVPAAEVAAHALDLLAASAPRIIDRGYIDAE
jgi:ADP-heptose:LPS heptosyltransferase